jgi:anion-transporting  ArsA/GET3 family ATPase
MEYSVIVFDTAPTGHTLRFLSFPTVLEKALGKLSTLSGQFGPMIRQMSSMMGGQQDSQEDMFAKLESMRAVINEVNTQFKDPVRLVIEYTGNHLILFAGKDHVRLCLYLRVPVPVRDGASRSGTDGLRDRHA